MASWKLTGNLLCTLKRLTPCQSSVAGQRFYYTYSREPTHVLPRKPPVVSAEEAVKVVQSKNVVYFQTAAAVPRPLLYALTEYGKQANLKDVYVFQGLQIEPMPFLDSDFEAHFRLGSTFIGPFGRQAVKEGKGDYLPIMLSDVPKYFTSYVNIDVAMFQVSPPDKHGFCTLGISVDANMSVVKSAKYLIGLVNPQMPRTYGTGLIHMSHFDCIVEDDYELVCLPKFEPDENDRKIGKYIADNLVEDGATLQFGIGNIPDAITSLLKDRKDMGIHTEMISDGAIDLIESGCITNAHKKVMRGKTVTTFCLGSRQLYDYVNDNQNLYFGDANWVNDVNIIAKNPAVVGVNSCIEMDITGQTVSDSIGTYIYSGVGGQVDFLRGASLSQNGKAVVVLHSTTSKGESRIVPFLKQGAGVVTTRAHVHWVVTEHGICNLFGLPLLTRAYELIRIAHPDHRESLEKAAFQILGSMPTPPKSCTL